MNTPTSLSTLNSLSHRTATLLVNSTRFGVGTTDVCHPRSKPSDSNQQFHTSMTTFWERAPGEITYQRLEHFATCCIRLFDSEAPSVERAN